MSDSGVLASIQEYVERLQRREEGYTEEGLRGFNWHKAELAGCDLSGFNLRKLDMRGADLSEANLSRANLSEADLRKADLSKANLSEADLRKANLSKADLREADLSAADLRDADLSEAYLWWAKLRGADLSGANLRKANLSGAKLSAANLRGANLSGVNLWVADLVRADLCEADLSGANLRKADLGETDLSGTILNWDQIPLVPNIDAAILSALKGGGTLDMKDWHTCDTTHCRAGWAVVLAGDAGQKLEEQLGTNAAASLIYARSGSHPVPNWYADNETVLADIRKRAQKQLMASQPTSPEAKGIEIG